jgi:hypothetical protein
MVEHEQRSLDPSGDVALLIARRVDPGYEADFEQWAHGILSAAAGFPGHLGYGVFRPRNPGEPWYLVQRFRDAAAQERWLRSPERASWFARADGHHAEDNGRQLTGLETWFVTPDRPLPVPPPTWKIAVGQLLGIFPLTLVVTTVLGPAMAKFPVLVQAVVITAFFSGLVNYAVMPILARLLRRWWRPAGFPAT